MASERKTVAIVGAGPAGLVTAATLFRTHHFDITVFEKTSEVGGLWSPSGLIDPAMTANLCQHTISFTGLSWESIEPASINPKAREVTQYLKEYRRRYVPHEIVVFNTEVIRVESTDATVPGVAKWTITTSTQNATRVEVKESRFDLLVLATGPFSNPQKAWNFASDDLVRTSTIPIVHSTKYRSLADIKLGNEASRKPGTTILVVGGSHSGSEIASKIALELSTSAASEQTPQPKLIHVTSRKIFALSPLLPTGQEESVGFEPADFKLYNRSSRPPEPPVSFTYGLFNAQKHAGGVKMMRSLSGYESAIGAEESSDVQLSAVISESYAQLAAFGMIRPIQGKLQHLEQASHDQTLKATVKPRSGDTITVDNIIGVVYATGFNTAASVSFLDELTRAQLGYDPSCGSFPLLLDASYLSQNSNASTIAVIGFATQYWGVMEMQARAIAQAWVSDNMLPSPEERKGIMDYSIALRKAIRSDDTASIPPNPFGDYVGLVEQAARELRLERVDLKFNATEGPICPARYVDRDAKDQKQEAVKAITKLHELQHSSHASAAFTTKAVFYGLLGGQWHIKCPGTGIDAAVPNHDELVFLPRLSAHAGLDFEYLVTRRSAHKQSYEIYRLKEGTDHIAIWSASAERPFSALVCIAKLVFGGENAVPADAILARKIHAGTDQVIAEHRFEFAGTRIIRCEIIGATMTEDWRPAAIKE